MRAEDAEEAETDGGAECAEDEEEFEACGDAAEEGAG